MGAGRFPGPGTRKISKWNPEPGPKPCIFSFKENFHSISTSPTVGCFLSYKIKTNFWKITGFRPGPGPRRQKNNPAQNPEFKIFDPEPCPEPWFRVLNVKTHECDSNLVGSYLNPAPSYASSKVRNCQMCRSGTEGLTYFSPFEAQG